MWIRRRKSRAAELVRVMTPAQLTLRGVLLVTGVTALALASPSDGPQWVVMVIGALALLRSVGAPDGLAPLCVIAAVGANWTLRFTGDEQVPAVVTVLLAVSLYVFHTTAALVAGLPAAARIAPGTLRRWWARDAAVMVAGIAFGAAAFAVGGLGGGLLVDLLSLAGVLAVTGVLVLLARRDPTHRGSTQGEGSAERA